MQPRLIVGLTAVLLTLSLRAHAFDAAAHRLIGAIADQQLNPVARQHVLTDLGYDLRTAGPWVDCVRNVKRDGDQYRYTLDPQHPEYHAPCTAFESPQEQARLEDYARRHWQTCDGAGGGPCHGRYHYTDVAIQHRRYERRWLGTRDDDIVGAIAAAIAVLQGKPCPPPFRIADTKEALLMLAHFVGDLHQPLHVGSVYLNADAQPFDPDANGKTLHPDADTHGGNALRDPQTGRNLHAAWDRIPDGLGDIADATLVRQAQRVPPSPAPIDRWPMIWATESLQVARRAFNGLAYTADPQRPGQWQVQFVDRARYQRDQAALQQQAIIRAGARLAQLLNTVWPSQDHAGHGDGSSR